MSSHLIPCKFFATSSCRFGDSCRYSHSLNTTGNVFGGGRTFGTSGFGGGTQDAHSMQAKGQNNLDAIVETVKKDIQEWEMGKIWPFSSYGPVGNKPSLPGLEDISVEEMRHKFLQNNRMPPDLTQEMRNMQMSRQSYQHPTPQIRDIIERVIVKNERITTAPGSSSASIWNSATNSPAASGIFGGGSSAVATVPSVFGNSSQTQSVFGGAPSMFQQPSNTGVFGAVAPSSGSLFGSSTGFASLQKPAESVETMDGSLTQQSTPSIFGNQPQQPAGLFSTNQTSPFQSVTQNSVFGGSTFGQQQANVFQNQQPVSQPNSLFSTTQQPVQQSLFQNVSSPLAQPQPSAFQNISSPLSQPQASVFQASSPFAPQNPPNQPSMNPVQQATTTASPGLFSLLSQPVTTPTPQVQTTTQSSGIFGGQAQPQASWPQTTSNTVNQPTQAVSSQNFVQQQQQLQIPPVSVNEQKFVYSEESSLAMDQIEAFKADHFTLENIPTVPPPKAYCKM